MYGRKSLPEECSPNVVQSRDKGTWGFGRNANLGVPLQTYRVRDSEMEPSNLHSSKPARPQRHAKVEDQCGKGVPRPGLCENTSANIFTNCIQAP